MTATRDRIVSTRLAGELLEAWDEALRYGDRPSHLMHRLIRQAIERGELLHASPRRAELVESIRREMTAGQVDRVLGALHKIEATLDEMADTNPVHGWLLADALAETVAAYPKRVEGRSGVPVRVEA